MSTTNKINSFDEALRLIWLESCDELEAGDVQNNLKNILEAEYSVDMPAERQILLINKLYESVNVTSLGRLISENALLNNFTLQDLATESQLPSEVIRQLIEDELYPNNVPVLLFKKLISKLNILFTTAETAIWKTFEIIQKKHLVTESLPTKLVYRRATNSKLDSLITKNSKSHGSEIYENEHSLKLYLSQLEKLMK
jgi:hypothetical protein